MLKRAKLHYNPAAWSLNKELVILPGFFIAAEMSQADG
jgi:hypothetical protein